MSADRQLRIHRIVFQDTYHTGSPQVVEIKATKRTAGILVTKPMVNAGKVKDMATWKLAIRRLIAENLPA